MAFITPRKALLPLRRLSRGFVSNFVPEIFLYFWRKLQNTKCSGSSIDISLNSDMIVPTTNESCGCLLYQETPVHTVYAKQEERYEDHQTQRCGSAF